MPRRKCTVCGSLRFRKIEGQFVCEYGHQLQGYVEEQADEIRCGVSLGKRLYLSSKRVSIKKVHQSQVQFGEPALILFFEAFQEILKLQLASLEGLVPPSFNNTVFDLWQLHLLQHRKYVLFTTSKSIKRDDKHFIRLKVSYTLTILYLACVHTRMPIGLGDLMRAAVNGVIPYLNVHQSISIEHKSKLPSWFRSKLLTHSFPSYGALARQSSKVIRLLSSEYNVHFPSLNWPLFLNRYIIACHLPVATTFVLISRLHKLAGEDSFDLWVRGVLPEVNVMAFVVIALKLIYQLDNRPSRGINPIFHDQWTTYEEWISKFETEIRDHHSKNPMLSLNSLIDYSKTRPIEFAQYLKNSGHYFMNEPFVIADAKPTINDIYSRIGLSDSVQPKVHELIDDMLAHFQNDNQQDMEPPKLPLLESSDQQSSADTPAQREWSYSIYLGKDAVNYLPQRLQEVLGVCAYQVGCLKEDLHEAVCRIERKIAPTQTSVRPLNAELDDYTQDEPNNDS